jgi:hypothetical protein
MNNFIEKIYNELVEKREKTLTNKDYRLVCENMDSILVQIEQKILNDPVIYSNKEYYNLVAEAFSTISRLSTIIEIERDLKELKR